MLSVTCKPHLLSVLILNVIMLSVVALLKHLQAVTNFNYQDKTWAEFSTLVCVYAVHSYEY
jgi:hypothetical protein